MWQAKCAFLSLTPRHGPCRGCTLCSRRVVLRRPHRLSAIVRGYGRHAPPLTPTQFVLRRLRRAARRSGPSAKTTIFQRPPVRAPSPRRAAHHARCVALRGSPGSGGPAGGVGRPRRRLPQLNSCPGASGRPREPRHDCKNGAVQRCEPSRRLNRTFRVCHGTQARPRRPVCRPRCVGQPAGHLPQLNSCTGARGRPREPCRDSKNGAVQT